MEVDIFIQATAGEGRMILLPGTEKNRLWMAPLPRLSRAEKVKVDEKRERRFVTGPWHSKHGARKPRRKNINKVAYKRYAWWE